MRKKLYNLIIPIIFILSITFIGCGGGSGGSESSGLTYSGLTTPAEIDENNVRDIAAGAFAVGQTGTVMTISEGSQDYQNLTNLELDNFRSLRIPQILADAARSMDFSPPLHQLSVKADYTESDTKYGPCGGSVTYTINVNENSGEFNGNFNFSNYCEHGVTINGKTDVEGRINLNTYDIINITFSFDNLSDGSLTMDGKISMDFSVSPIICTMDGYYKDETTGKVFWAKGYSLNIFEYPGRIEVEIFGTFYHPDYGYVTLSTPDPFIVFDGYEWPNSGTLLIVGAKNTKAKLTAIDETRCRIEADTNGDDIYDWDSGNLYWSDFNSFFTEVGGIIDTDTVWDLSNSPYYIINTVQVAEGVTLTIEPGVSIDGEALSEDMEIWGNLNAIGNNNSRIYFNKVTIKSYAKSFIDIAYSAFYGGSPCYDSFLGGLSLKNSIIQNTLDISMIVGFQCSCPNTSIEKNFFINAGMIKILEYGGDYNVYIKNNIFEEQKDVAVKHYGVPDYPTSETIVQYNSFLSTDRIALMVNNEGYMVGTNNYWNTTDISIINDMIYDRNDDLNVSNYIEYLPILTQPHPDTPTYP